MTAAALSPAVEYSGNGVTLAFAAPFRFLTGTLTVDLISSAGVVTRQTLGTHYSVTGGATDAGGTVTMVTAPASGAKLRIRRDTPRAQTTDYVTSDTFPAESHEQALDKLTLIAQEQDVTLNDIGDRAILVPDGETGGTVAAASARADRLLGFGTAPGAAPAVSAFTMTALASVLAAIYTPAHTQLADLVTYIADGTGAVARSVQDMLREKVSPKSYGAIADGSSHPLSERYATLAAAQAVYPFATALTQQIDWAALQAAINYCKANSRCTLHMARGAYRIDTTLDLNNLPGGVNGITIKGGSNLRHGGGATSKPAVLLQWVGGGAAMATSDASYLTLEGFGVENVGAATRFLTLTGGQHQTFRRLSFITNSPAIVRFSQACFYAEGNQLGYSIFDNIHCYAASQNFILIDGLGSSNGLTPFEIRGRCVFESNGDGSMTVVYIRDENIDQLSIRNCTFNQQANKLVILDTRDTPTPQAITQLAFEENEIDIVGGVSADRLFYLTNCENIAFNKNQIQGGGAITALVELVNSTVTQCRNNSVLSLAGPLFNVDVNSAVFAGVNQLSVLNTRGIMSDGPNLNILRPAWGAQVALQPWKLPDGGEIEVTATSGIASELRIEHPINGFMRVGQDFWIIIRNNSGGALGAMTPDTRRTWKLAGAALPAPANGMYRALHVRWTGAYLRELGRLPADIAI